MAFWAAIPWILKGVQAAKSASDSAQQSSMPGQAVSPTAGKKSPAKLSVKEALQKSITAMPDTSQTNGLVSGGNIATGVQAALKGFMNGYEGAKKEDKNEKFWQ
jgi:hypothetical protein